MGSAAGSYIWTMRAAYLGLSVIVIFVQLLPLETTPRGWVGPDLLLALTFVWVARRPDLAPIWAVAAIFLLSDLLLQRPPGLWSACVVIATEVLRARTSDLREIGFAVEWGIAAIILIGLYLAYTVLWSLTVPFAISNGLLAMQLAFTILVYPLVAIASGAILGVAKAAPGQTDAQGRLL
ncbi:MAG: rod shape-determining protein MreD [Pseudomonadota bacterium]